MCQAMIDLKEEGKQEGLAEGRQAGLAEGREAGFVEGRQVGLVEGRQEGLAEGRQAGLVEGRRENCIENAKALVGLLSPECIARKLKLPLETVLRLKAERKRNMNQ